MAFLPVTGLIFGRMCLVKYDCWSSVTSVLESNKDGAFGNSSLHYFHFGLCQNGGTVNFTNQVFFSLRVSMRNHGVPSKGHIVIPYTTLFLSSGLVCDQRRSQFSDCLGSQSAVFFSGCPFSRASPLFNLIQFYFRQPVSLQYQQECSGYKEPSVPGTSCGGQGFTKYGMQPCHSGAYCLHWCLSCWPQPVW